MCVCVCVCVFFWVAILWWGHFSPRSGTALMKAFINQMGKNWIHASRFFSLFCLTVFIFWTRTVKKKKKRKKSSVKCQDFLTSVASLNLCLLLFVSADFQGDCWNSPNIPKIEVPVLVFAGTPFSILGLPVLKSSLSPCCVNLKKWL